MKKLTDCCFSLAESPRYIAGSLYFTDINAGKLYRYTNETLEMIWDKEQITSFVADESGGMVFATMHGLYYMSPDGAYEQLVPDLKINDMGVDPKGRVVFGTNYHSKEQSYPLGSLFVYDKAEGLRELDYGYHLANGIGFSPDGTKMYVCDSSVRVVFEYPYDPETGTCGRKRILIRFRMEAGIPDGMAVDEEGCIWTAQWYGRCVIRVSPSGEELCRIKVPDAQVSAVEFTPEGLVITTSGTRGRLDIAPNHFSLDDPDVLGGLYVTDPGVGGNPHIRSDIFAVKN